jgi:hypothetical protein
VCAISLPTFTAYDIVLIVAVSIHATVLAYLSQPRWKAFLLTLPIPFTLASLSLGVRVSTSNLSGLVLLLGYTYGVYYLHARRRVPIVACIALCAVGYCVVGALVAPWLPNSEAAFWGLASAILVLAVLLYRVMPHLPEPSHRSPLPVYLKLPLIAAVIFVLVVIKKYLQGFMTLFPMIGVVASYEGRHCLWTLTRQVPVIMMTLLPLMATVRVLYPLTGIGPALGGGWLAFLLVLTPLTAQQWREEAGG